MRPRESSPFVEDVLGSLKRRSKAFKNRNAQPEIERFIEREDGETLERVEIKFRLGKRQILGITIWSDRFVQVGAHEPGLERGWTFTTNTEGRCVGHAGGKKIVEAIEATISAMFDLTQEEVGKLEVIWQPLLAQGPTPID